MALNLPRLQAALPIVDSAGRPIASFLRWWQSVATAAEDNASLSDPSYITIANSTLLANERSLLAGGGLTLSDAGPNLTVSLAVGAGTGITIGVDTVGLDLTSTLNTDHASVTLTAGAGLTGGGDITTNRTFDVGAGTGITVNADTVALDTASTRNTDHTAITLTAGAGLTGGGDISANRTFDIGAGTGITVNANDVALTIPTDSGTYTPTLTNVANLDASTAYVSQYNRVGSAVTVSGRVSIDPTLAATSTQLGISLPVASNFANIEQCGGAAFSPAIAGQGAAILADITNNRAQLEYISGDITNQDMYFSFTYLIV